MSKLNPQEVLDDMKSSLAIVPDAPPSAVRGLLLASLQYTAEKFRAGDEGHTAADEARGQKLNY